MKLKETITIFKIIIPSHRLEIIPIEYIILKKIYSIAGKRKQLEMLIQIYFMLSSVLLFLVAKINNSLQIAQLAPRYIHISSWQAIIIVRSIMLSVAVIHIIQICHKK